MILQLRGLGDDGTDYGVSQLPTDYSPSYVPVEAPPTFNESLQQELSIPSGIPGLTEAQWSNALLATPGAPAYTPGVNAPISATGGQYGSGGSGTSMPLLSNQPKSSQPSTSSQGLLNSLFGSGTSTTPLNRPATMQTAAPASSTTTTMMMLGLAACVVLVMLSMNR
jgi:hypothetical protein